jgi:hypothetical protein
MARRHNPHDRGVVTAFSVAGRNSGAETEVNFMRYYVGPHGGNTSVYRTPVIVLGRFHLWDRLAFTVGGGYEIAVTSFHPANHVATGSARSSL